MHGPCPAWCQGAGLTLSRWPCWAGAVPRGAGAAGARPQDSVSSPHRKFLRPIHKGAVDPECGGCRQPGPRGMTARPVADPPEGHY